MSEQLLRDLKTFAFEESPQFADGQVSAISIERTFYLPDNTPPDFRDFPNPDNAESAIEIGFSGSRRYSEHGRKIYRFDAYALSWQYISPYELKLTEDDWFDIQAEQNYEDDDDLRTKLGTSDGILMDDDNETVITPMVPEDIQDLLSEDQITCTFYRRVDFRFESDDNQIRLNDERGYTVGEEAYNVNETHLGYLDKSQQEPSLHDEAILEDGTTEALQGLFNFYDATESLRRELRKSGNLMPPEDGANEILFLINCLRQKKIVLS